MADVATKFQATLVENEELIQTLEDITSAYNGLKPDNELLIDEC
jgi:hypothetical protein